MLPGRATRGADCGRRAPATRAGSAAAIADIANAAMEPERGRGWTIGTTGRAPLPLRAACCRWWLTRVQEATPRRTAPQSARVRALPAEPGPPELLS